MQIADTRTLVTGGGSGLGRMLCLHLARAGAWVCVSDRDEAAAEATAGEILASGGAAAALRLDVTVDADIQHAVKFLAEQGGLDILVNNAGIAATGSLEESPEEQWRTIIDLNLMSVVNMSRACLPLLQSGRPACIVNVASAAGLVHLPGMISYNVTKAAVIAFSESVRIELQGSPVQVVCACPSFFKTNILDATLDLTEEDRKRVEDAMSRSRIQADDVAKAILRAIRRSKFMVLTHGDSRVACLVKNVFPGLYPRMMEFVVRQMEKDARALLAPDSNGPD